MEEGPSGDRDRAQPQRPLNPHRKGLWLRPRRKRRLLSGPKGNLNWFICPSPPHPNSPCQGPGSTPFLSRGWLSNLSTTPKCPSPDLAPGLSPNPKSSRVPALSSSLTSPGLAASPCPPVPPLPLIPSHHPPPGPLDSQVWLEILAKETPKRPSQGPSLTVGGSELCLKRSKHQAQSKVVLGTPRSDRGAR